MNVRCHPRPGPQGRAVALFIVHHGGWPQQGQPRGGARGRDEQRDRARAVAAGGGSRNTDLMADGPDPGLCPSEGELSRAGPCPAWWPGRGRLVEAEQSGLNRGPSLSCPVSPVGPCEGEGSSGEELLFQTERQEAVSRGRGGGGPGQLTASHGESQRGGEKGTSQQNSGQRRISGLCCPFPGFLDPPSCLLPRRIRPSTEPGSARSRAWPWRPHLPLRQASVASQSPCQRPP